jgi:catechol 2,3-dioxygenase-like lactoylglutathione lyase family enzyme
MLSWAQAIPTRPKILRIVSVDLLSSNAESARSFYSKVLTVGGQCIWCQTNMFEAAVLPSDQVVNVIPSSENPTNRLVKVTFGVESEKAIRQWLTANKVPINPSKDGAMGFSVLDPEGHEVAFVDIHKKYYPMFEGRESVGKKLIHAGWVVKDRVRMDTFYKDVLGFHVYWSGGMKDDETNWVDMQVPDGTDWIEYMLRVPDNADSRLRGVMNHIALGVPDIHAAAAALEANGMKLSEQPKVGRDGKWQLNLYDPDQTRVELMEFTPAQKACCSEYTGPHPKP